MGIPEGYVSKTLVVIYRSKNNEEEMIKSFPLFYCPLTYASTLSTTPTNFASTINTPRTDTNKFTLDSTWGYNSMYVDVVPYITDVETNISKTAGTEFARSALGNYVIRAGESFTINGFNLGGTSATVKLGGQTLSITSGKSNSLTVKSTTSSVTSFLEIESNGKTSINNINICFIIIRSYYRKSFY